MDNRLTQEKNQKSKTIKFFYAQTGCFYYRAQSTFRNIFPRMIRNNSYSMCCRIKPNFMAAFGMTVKNKAGFTQFMDNLTWFKGRKITHLSKRTGMLVSNLCDGGRLERIIFGIGLLCSMHDSIIFRATSSAISIVSAIVRPWAISPWSTELVARYPPSCSGSIDMGIKYSDISTPPLFEVYHKDTSPSSIAMSIAMSRWK